METINLQEELYIRELANNELINFPMVTLTVQNIEEMRANAN